MSPEATLEHAKGKAGPSCMQLHTPCPHGLFGKNCCFPPSLPACHISFPQKPGPPGGSPAVCKQASQLLVALLEISLAVTEKQEAAQGGIPGVS